MRTSKFSPRIRGELEGGKIKPVSFSTKASGIVKYLEKPNPTRAMNHTNRPVSKYQDMLSKPASEPLSIIEHLAH